MTPLPVVAPRQERAKPSPNADRRLTKADSRREPAAEYFHCVSKTLRFVVESSNFLLSLVVSLSRETVFFRVEVTQRKGVCAKRSVPIVLGSVPLGSVPIVLGSVPLGVSLLP